MFSFTATKKNGNEKQPPTKCLCNGGISAAISIYLRSTFGSRWTGTFFKSHHCININVVAHFVKEYLDINSKVEDFVREIAEEEEKLKNDGQRIVNEMISKFKEQLYRYTGISTYQAAFLKRLDEKWDTEIYPLIIPHVLKELNDWYGDDNEDRQVFFQGVSIPEKGSVDWEINFEDETVDPIIHIYMKGWAFDYSALTG